MANIDVIRNVYAAFANGDIPGVLGAMAPDIVWNEAENYAYADRNPYVGPNAILEGVFMRIGGEWSSFAVEQERLIDGGDTIVMLGRYRGVWKANGREMNPQVVHVWTFKDGQIVRFQQYLDTLAASRVMG